MSFRQADTAVASAHPPHLHQLPLSRHHQQQRNQQQHQTSYALPADGSQGQSPTAHDPLSTFALKTMNHFVGSGSAQRSLHTSQSQPQLRPHAIPSSSTSSSSTFMPSTTAPGSHYGFPPTSLPPLSEIPNQYAASPEPSHQELMFPSSSSTYLPSHLPLDSSSHLHRASSLSPVHHMPVSHGSHLQPTTGLSRSASAAGAIGASLSRSVSADAAAPPQPSSNHLVQRLAQQNKLIRESWEAERNYLEANRRRAEEVYQEERVIMDAERDAWDAKRLEMEREMQTMKERIQRLEGENLALKSMATQNAQLSGMVSPQLSQRDGSVDSHKPHAMILKHPHFGSPPNNGGFQLPPGLEGASRRPHFISSPNGGGSRQSPSTQPESSPFIPLDPRMQPQKPVPDFLSSPSEDSTPVPIIDVHEIDPKLEGIPIKATAVSKWGLGDTSSKPSPATSPPVTDTQHQAVKQGGASSSPPGMFRTSSRDQTLQVLKAEESQRRTMHAGHTPNHSLSLFPTINITGGSTASAGLSERTTPTAAHSSAPSEHHDDKGDTVEDKGKGAEDLSVEKPPEPLPTGVAEIPGSTFEPPLEPADDVPLKGPLMIKNIPAQDEIFWDLVNKKLEPISEGRDALPSVMRIRGEDIDNEAGQSSSPGDCAPERNDDLVGGDASQDGVSDTQPDKHGREQVIEDPVPLKLKSTTNFGAPFGTV